MLLNCGFGEDSLESLGLQGDQTSQSCRKSTLNIHWKDWCWSRSSNTLVTWCEDLTCWERSWCWERLKAKEEGVSRRWDRLNSITGSMDMIMRKLWEIVKDRETWLAAVHGMAKNQTQLNNKFENSYLQTFFENGYPPISTSTLLTMPKPLTVWITINCGKFWKRWEYQTTWPAYWETCMQVRKQQLELNMEQQTGPK